MTTTESTISSSRQSTRTRKTRKILLAAGILVPLAGLAVASFFLRGTLTEQQEFQLVFDDARQLPVGANVWRRGSRIGVVTAIDSSGDEILVSVRIDNQNAQPPRVSDCAAITVPLLGVGQKSVKLYPCPNEESRTIPAGHKLKGFSPTRCKVWTTFCKVMGWAER